MKRISVVVYINISKEKMTISLPLYNYNIRKFTKHKFFLIKTKVILVIMYKGWNWVSNGNSNHGPLGIPTTDRIVACFYMIRWTHDDIVRWTHDLRFSSTNTNFSSEKLFYWPISQTKFEIRKVIKIIE